MKETVKFTVSVHDEDAFGNMRASAMLRRMQECANIQYRKMTAPNGRKTVDDMAEKNRGFIVCKFNMNVYRACHAYDELTVESWISKEKGVVSERLYKVFCNGELVCEGAAAWAIVEDGTKILRASEYEDLSVRDDDICTVEIPKHIRIPCPEKLELMGEKQILYSDIDVNCHMNNTYYPDMLASFIPEMRYERFTSDKGRYISSISINYLAEAPLGDTVKVYSYKDEDGIIYFRTVRGDGKTNIEAHVRLAQA